jgi:hypothetical protein
MTVKCRLQDAFYIKTGVEFTDFETNLHWYLQNDEDVK